MKFEEFKRHKKIAESIDSSDLQKFPEVSSVYAWLEQNDRIDEGLWQNIWNWLKKNLSPTGRKLYKLADEFEKELEAELRAEYGKIKDSKDLASKMRASYAGRLSGDIEERMSIVAGDDDVYRELSRELVNERTLRAKKRVITNFGSVLDDTDRKKLTDDWDDELAKTDRKIRKLFSTDRDVYEKLSNELNRLIEANKSMFADIIKTLAQKEYMMKAIIAYTKYLADKEGKDATAKSAFIVAKQYAKLVKEIAGTMTSLGKSKEELYAEIRRALNSLLMAEKPGDSIEKMKREAAKLAKKRLEESGDDEEEETDTEISKEDLEEEGIVTPDSETVIGKDGVENAIDTAKDDTEENNPTAEDIAEEITNTVDTYFAKNLVFITGDLSSKVEKFNKLPEDERKRLKAEFNYNLDAEDKLEPAGEQETQSLIEDFRKLVGEVVPYYDKEVSRVKIARSAVSKFIFEIYAIKKDATKKLTDVDRKRILEAIKEKYNLR
jgi:hypothetical protein